MSKIKTRIIREKLIQKFKPYNSSSDKGVDTLKQIAKTIISIPHSKSLLVLFPVVGILIFIILVTMMSFAAIIPTTEIFAEENNSEHIYKIEGASESRTKIIETALSLVDRVPYFWGGKSKAGWNDEWNKPRLVTAPGNKNTGKYIPYGLDCSGFVGWVYDTAGFGNVLSGSTSTQWENSYPITKEELLPGDLGFKQPPSAKGVNHVGIFYKIEDNKYLFIHCAGGSGVVVNSYNFRYYRRAYVNFKEEAN